MHQRMNVIRHYTPSKQFIVFVMKMKHGVLGNLGDSRITQMTFTDTTVEILLQFCALFPIIFNLEERFPLGAPRDRHGISQAKGDELNQTRKITMRQIAAFMPAEEAQGLFFICQRTERFVFPFDKLAKIFALGSRWNGLIQTLTKPLSRKPIHWSAEHLLGKMKSD